MRRSKCASAVPSTHACAVVLFACLCVVTAIPSLVLIRVFRRASFATPSSDNYRGPRHASKHYEGLRKYK